MEALIRAQLVSNPGATINPLSIAGTNGTFTYNDFTLDIDLTAKDIDVPTTTVVDGAFKANLYQQATSEFCLNVYSARARPSRRILSQVSLTLIGDRRRVRRPEVQD